jgi:tetratricopeptide (TPR) repeat protein
MAEFDKPGVPQTQVTNQPMNKTAIFLLALLLFCVPAVHGENAMDYYDLGVKGSNTRKKIAHFTKALQLNPNLAAAYEKRGLLYYFQGEYDRVIQDYNKYLDFEPAKPEAYWMLGMGYLKSENYEPAINNFSRAITMEPENLKSYAYRAEAYRLTGKDEKAFLDANKAIELRGDLRAKSDAYRTRAKLYWKIGRNELAAADVKSSWQIDPRVPRWWRYFLNSASPEELRSIAPFLMIALVLVLIFGFKMKPPQKGD